MSNKALLASMCSFAAPKSPVAALSAVRIAESFLYATDNNSSMRVEWEGPAGMDVAVPAQRLAAALAGMPDDQHIKLQQSAGTFIHLVAGKRKLKLNTVALEGMPTIEVKGKDELAFQAVENIAEAIKFAMIGAEKKSLVRPQYNGVLIEMTPTGTFAVGTDGYRMHIAKFDDTPGEGKSLIPLPLASRLVALMKAGGDIAFNQERVVWRNEGHEYIGVLASTGGFPNWQSFAARFDPTEQKSLKITGSQANIHSAVRDVERLDFSPVVLEAKKGILAVSAGTQAGEEFEQEIEIDQPGTGQFTSAFNPRFICDAMDGFKEWPTISLPDAASGNPMILRHGGTAAYIQAMRT